MSDLEDILHIVEQGAYVRGGQFGSLTNYNIVRSEYGNGCLVTKRVQSASNVHELYWSVSEYVLSDNHVEKIFTLIKNSEKLITNRSYKDEPLHYMSIYYINGVFKGTPFSTKVESVFKGNDVDEIHPLVSELTKLKNIDENQT